MKRKENGQLLLEVLLTVAAVSVLSILGAELIFSGNRSNQIAGDKDIALGLADQTLNAVQASAVGDWTSIYNLGKGSGNLYHPAQSSGKWSIVSGNDTTLINGISYTSSFYIQNVNRDINGNIVLTGGVEDPSTQKIVVTISWPNGDPVIENSYITRWRNIVCNQSDWSGGVGTTGTCPNPGNKYESATGLIIGNTIELAPGP